ncbi:MAG TPA: phosphopantetheine-binding protein [Actinophytocola sp.]|jgi:acyl carrier protein|uniref:phosphopantetheine-binding protein n=1 Tax=Actinophytocola sp. TaxID=1872138 RepID=UPI002F91ECE0
MATLEVPSEFQEILRPHLPYADAGDLLASSELASLGLDSMSLVELLADVEDRYDVELPDDILNESTFATVGSLWEALCPLVVTAGAESS